jgi:hypothetical protein
MFKCWAAQLGCSTSVGPVHGGGSPRQRSTISMPLASQEAYRLHLWLPCMAWAHGPHAKGSPWAFSTVRCCKGRGRWQKEAGRKGEQPWPGVALLEMQAWRRARGRFFACLRRLQGQLFTHARSHTTHCTHSQMRLDVRLQAYAGRRPSCGEDPNRQLDRGQRREESARRVGGWT